MNYSAEGKIIHRSEISGVTRDCRAWKKTNYVLETLDLNASKIPFSVFESKYLEINLQPGDTIRLIFSIQGREYNGKWYVDINAISAEKLEVNDIETKNQDSTDKLPF